MSDADEAPQPGSKSAKCITSTTMITLLDEDGDDNEMEAFYLMADR